ncbi:hypothetical protein [Microlunatus sp. Gsoil 973]|uniref:hypothetical protein n=1 Tax=Microlunatus sp. Gsoil 973 TaxID=2672569 RepID=UPI0012B4551A|nr:hypothetical protein [Microlunatus sp. Gsoil 973]QGN34875.1 hypothetical protein GJV80_20925 [Microlunatus sp. Gsoil 973]
MTLPTFDIATTVIVEERWHGLLWSAFPARVITSTADELVRYTPEGTIATYATNRDLPEAEGLTREERKLLALKTRQAVVAERPDSPHKLNIHRAGHCLRHRHQGPRTRHLGRPGPQLALEGSR